MKIIYIHQYYFTPEQGGAIRSYHLAKGLADKGWEVEVITGHNQKSYEIGLEGKVKVHRLAVSYDNQFGFFRRLLAFLHFIIKAKRLIRSLGKPDLFYITSTPLSTGFLGLWAKKKWGIPFVFEVRDLWPEAPIQVKRIRNKWIKRYLYGLEERIYKAANKIVALSPGIAEHILIKCPNKEVAVIPNFSDTEFFQNQTAPSLPGSTKTRPLTISYVGAVGEVNDLARFLSLAEMAKQKGKKWHFNIMGKGNQLFELINQKKNRNLENVSFLPFGNKLEVRRVLKETDLIYISFAPFPVLETSSPNKFFDALAVGKPVIVNFKGWIWEVIRENDIGIFHQYGCEEEAVTAIQNMENQPEKLIATGKKARTLAGEKFSKSMAISHLHSFLKTVE